MIRSVIPLIAFMLFFLEPVFSLFSPIEINDNVYILVPRFVIVHLLFIAVFYKSKTALGYALLFGLLYDIFYIDIIGLYAFLYPFIIYIGNLLIKYIHKTSVSAILLTVLLISLLEVFSYGFSSIISITTLDFKSFMETRLMPTVIANMIFVIMYALFFHYVLEKKVMVKLRTTSNRI